MRIRANELFLPSAQANSEEQAGSQSFKSCNSSISSDDTVSTTGEKDIPKQEQELVAASTKLRSSSPQSAVDESSEQCRVDQSRNSPVPKLVASPQSNSSPTLANKASKASRKPSSASTTSSVIISAGSTMSRTPSSASSASRASAARRFRRRRTTGSLSTAEKRKSSAALSTKSDITMSLKKLEKSSTRGGKTYPWSRRLSGENHASLVSSGFFDRRDLPKRKLTRLPVHGLNPIKVVEDRPFSMVRTPTKFYSSDQDEEGPVFSFDRLSCAPKTGIHVGIDSLQLAAVDEEIEEDSDTRTVELPTRRKAFRSPSTESSILGKMTEAGNKSKHEMSLAAEGKRPTMECSPVLIPIAEEELDEDIAGPMDAQPPEYLSIFQDPDDIVPVSQSSRIGIKAQTEASRIKPESSGAFVPSEETAWTKCVYEHGPIRVENSEDVLRKATIANLASWHENAASSIQRQADKALLEAIVVFFESWVGVSDGSMASSETTLNKAERDDAPGKFTEPILDRMLIRQCANEDDGDEVSEIAEMFREPPRAAPKPPPPPSLRSSSSFSPSALLPPLNIPNTVDRSSITQQGLRDRKSNTTMIPAKPKLMATPTPGITSLLLRRTIF